LIASWLIGTPRLGAFILTTGLAWAVFIGVPIYLTLRWKKWANVATCVLAGFTVVALPIGVKTWPLRYAAPGSMSSVNGVATMIDGVPTAAGWAMFASGVFRLAVLGAIGGLVFWLVLELTGESTTAPRRSAKRVIAVFVSSVVAALAAGTIWSVPSVTQDTSCHGTYTPGQIGASIDLQVDDGEWNGLTELLRSFAAIHELSFRDSSEVRPNVVRTLYLSVCDGARIDVFVGEQRWASRGYRPPIEGRGVGIRLAFDPARREPARDLIARLEARWPRATRFLDGQGYVVPMPAELAPATPAEAESE
jgi:hypothetical protein